LVYIYLDGLSACLKGEREKLQLAAQRAVDIVFQTESLSYDKLSNKAVLFLATGDRAVARGIYEQLINEKQNDLLRYWTIPELADLARALPERFDIQALRQKLILTLWPNGCGIEGKPDTRKVTLLSSKRGAYPFPVYCQLSGIQGLHEDIELARTLLLRDKSGQRAIVLWTLERPDRIFGQCNFKKDADAQYDLKFCDSLNTILSTNLGVLVKQFGVRRLLFLEEDLLKRFKEAAISNCLAVDCVLVEPAN
jgi:hypothetical protein